VRDKSFIVLLYHRIGTPAAGQDQRLFVRPDNLDRHLRFLRKRQYHFINLQEAVDFLHYRAPLPPRSVMVTFDDGFLDTTAQKPILLRENGR